ncbi:MAG: hypothetical protein B6U76_12425 [Desulfurococcales archaeon ex4484_217_2]|nr:MAG: hypothetical protein B6U76_12425 [Desulfurococcales archaeon ex4484_217_2]
MNLFRLQLTFSNRIIEVISYDGDRAEAVRQEALSKLVEYAVAHGVKYFVIEGLSKPNKVRSNVRK